MLPSEPCCHNFRPLLGLLALALSVPVHAQPDTRDELIEDLRRRIDALEHRLKEPPPEPAKPPEPKPAAPPPTKPPAEESAEKDESSRALERALVREGGLVLPRGSVEVEPRLQYTYRGSEGLGIVTLNGAPQVTEQDVKRNEVEASIGIRVGLPFVAQAEVRLPFNWLHQNRAVGGGQAESERTSGVGDIELGLSKQLLTEAAARPSLLASVNWRIPTGRHKLGRLSPGGGFHQLQGALTAVKRQDPLVFFGTFSYTAALERSREGVDVDPGDAVGVKAGVLLAASPETSLRGNFEVSRVSRTRIGGTSVAGSDATVGVLELGLASLLTSSTLFDVLLGIGITPDAPDLRLRISLPIRF